MSSKTSLAAPVGVDRPTTFNPLHHPIVFTTPRLLSPHSAWIGHIPFALLLIDLLRPRCVVELGVHGGDSYNAFCQAIDLLGLDCHATGIDTWAGDPQAGGYSPDILPSLRRHHDPLYGRFSRLLQTTFDAALAEFPDRSIDLLHIDGRHDYDTVRHDFYTWRPKLSDHAVVLLHDTHEHGPGFGVHRLWDELCAAHEHVEFPHAAGLGLLILGERIPEALHRFIAEMFANAAPVQHLFAALGQRLEAARDANLRSADLATIHDAANQWRRATGQSPRSSPHPNLSLAALHVRDDLAAAATDARQLRQNLRLLRLKLARRLRLLRAVSFPFRRLAAVCTRPHRMSARP